VQPAPAPRFSRSVPRPPTPPPAIGSDAHAVLSDWGMEADEVVRLEEMGAFRTRS
jgi:alpha-methylacyl-CoA racemase